MLNGLIDMHSHILPGLDDGSPDMMTSVKMAQKYVECGFTAVTATPHHIEGSAWAASALKIIALTKQLQDTLVQQNICLTVKTGMEIAYSPQFWEKLNDGAYLPLANSNTYLVEFPFQDDSEQAIQNFKACLAENEQRNFIIAHPERCAAFQNNPLQLVSLVQLGCYVQLNMSSFLGLYGKKSQQTAHDIINYHWCHIVSTDSHGLTKRGVPKEDAINQLTKILGLENFKAAFRTNPSCLQQNLSLTPLSEKIKELQPDKQATNKLHDHEKHGLFQQIRNLFN